MKEEFSHGKEEFCYQKENGLLAMQKPNGSPRPSIPNSSHSPVARTLLSEGGRLHSFIHSSSRVQPTLLTLAAIFKKPRDGCEVKLVTPRSSSHFCSMPGGLGGGEDSWKVKLEGGKKNTFFLTQW